MRTDCYKAAFNINQNCKVSTNIIAAWKYVLHFSFTCG